MPIETFEDFEQDRVSNSGSIFSGRDRGRLSVSRLFSLSWPLGKLVQIILQKMQELDDLTEQYAPDDYVQRQKLFR